MGNLKLPGVSNPEKVPGKKNGSPPLHVAAFDGDWKLCSYYIDRGANINEQNQVMETPLHVAA